VSRTYRVERLAKHDRSQFDCGVPELNIYLRKQAGQDQRRRFSVCHLLIDATDGSVAGYYTLTAGSVLLADLPQAITRKLPRYPTVPVARIGRLAVAIAYHGQKLGGLLLYDAVQRVSAANIGVYAVVVDAKDDNAVSFYEHHGFTRFESVSRTLFFEL